MAKQVSELAGIAKSGDRLATLEALRDRLAAEIDECQHRHDLASLALRLTDVLQQIDSMPQTQKVSRADEIAERRAARRGAGAAHKARAKARSQ